MKLWLASANQSEIVDMQAYPLQGVITNPSVIALEKRDWRKVVQEMDQCAAGPIHVQTTTETKEEMLAQFMQFRSLVTHNALIAKLPVSRAGLSLIAPLQRLGHQVNITAVCSLSQAMLAIEAGADYLSVYVGRVTDAGGDGMLLVRQIKACLMAAGSSAQVIAASIRTLEQLEAVALAGADAVAIPGKLLGQMADHPLTAQSLSNFQADWDAL